jgi:peptide/nickel transport system permease protein
MSADSSPPSAPGPPRGPKGFETVYEVFRTLWANPLTFAGAVLVFLMTVTAILVVVLPPLGGLIGLHWTIVPYGQNTPSTTTLAPPSTAHWFGTDELGRDIFSRVLVALPLDLGVSAFIIAAAVVIGGVLGLYSGFYDDLSRTGRVLSVFILRVTDVFLAFPTLILALAIAALLGRNLTATTIALVATWWPYYVRLVRGEVLTIKHQGYIAAARALGVTNGRIVRRHVLRNLLEPIIVYMTLDIGTVIVTFSTIAYVGIALPVDSPEWGSMISYYQSYLPNYLWLVIGPGAAIFVSVLALSLLGDGLREVLDPRSRRAFSRVSRTTTAVQSATPDAPGEA